MHVKLTSKRLFDIWRETS